VSELSQIAKKEMAKQRLHENLEPPFVAALAEGLTPEDIQEIVSKVLKKNGAVK
jgi:hypothetical protein